MPVGWQRELAEVREELRRLNGAAEAGFLAIGGQLGSVLEDCRRMQAVSEARNAAVSGRTAEEAGQALAEARAYLERLQARAEQSGQALRALRETAGRIQAGFGDLGKVVMGFRVAATVARIEIAVLGEAGGAEGLAEEVRRCAGSIEARAGQVLRAAAEMRERLGASLARVGELARRQEREVPALLERIDEDLAALGRRQVAVVRANERMAEELRGVERELGAILEALQFQDITRQQLEHVAEALESVERAAWWGRPDGEAGETLRVQWAQLAAAEAAFQSSVASLERGLDDLGTRVAALARCGGEESGSGFLGELESRLKALGEAVEEFREADGLTAEEMRGWSGAARVLADSAKEIQAIEIQLHRIAVNTSISACHSGEAADPLAVVGEALRKLQEDCSACSARAGEPVAAMERALAEPAGGGEGGGPDPAGRLRQVVGELRARLEAGEAGAARIGEMARGIGRQLRAARARAGMGAAFGEGVQRAQGRMSRVMEQTGRRWSFPRRAGSGRKPEYTMAAERAVHEAALAGRAGAGAGVERSGAPGGEVEFF